MYFPTSDAEDDVIEDIYSYSGLEEFCKLAKGEGNLKILGDWNVIVGERTNGHQCFLPLLTPNERRAHFFFNKL